MISPEFAAMETIDRAANLLQRFFVVLGRGDLPRARALLCDYTFTLLDVQDFLPLCRNGANLLDAVNDRLLRGLRYLDIELDESETP
jgi:ketosteroid isomerase-like protein